MGNIDSIPVVSQVKSLVQVVSGDDNGAKSTQENFLRTGPIVSQGYSAYLSINGDNDEARKVQEEFGKEMQVLAEGMPIIGHGVAAGYAIAGDTEKAEEVALGATKSTVVALGSVAGLACGPGAPACGAVLATTTNLAWDGVESGVRGELSGSIAGIKDIVDGKGDAGEVFDTVAGQGIVAASGALGASGGFKAIKGRKVLKSNGKVLKGKGKEKASIQKVRCKRSTDDITVIDYQLNDLPKNLSRALPGHIRDLEKVQWDNVDEGINAVFSIFLIIKLFLIGHPTSQKYFEEVCNHVYPTFELQECENHIMEAIEKYDNGEEATENVFEDSLSALIFEYNQMVQNNTIGNGLYMTMCLGFSRGSKQVFEECELKTHGAMHDLKELFTILEADVPKSRVKRDGCFTRPIPRATDKFLQRHSHADFKVLVDKMDRNLLTSDDIKSIITHREKASSRLGNPSSNTLIDENVTRNLKSNSHKHSDPLRREIWMTNEPYELIQINTISGTVQHCKGYIKFTLNKLDQVSHMEPPIIMEYGQIFKYE